jgi:antitoxin (DNA-binding transcriptional repressor) of toxin-antitoxin stability system
MAAMGAQVHRAEISDNGQRALAQVICRDFGRVLRVGYLARGPVWQCAVDAAGERATMRLIRRTLPGGGVLLASPDRPVAGLVPLMTPVHVAELALTPDRETLRRRLHGKWRNRLVRAEAAGLRITVCQPEPASLDWLIARDIAQQRARGYRALPGGFARAWGRDGRVMLSAHRDGKTVAAMLFLDHAPGVTYQIGWTSDAGRANSAHNLLLWRAMLHFADLGRRRLDLGMLDTETAPGLARFKLGTGARARALGSSGICLPGWPVGLRRLRSGQTSRHDPGHGRDIA